MHAILGLAASDLMSQDPSLVTSAMAHRVKAIGAIKKSLADAASSSSSSSSSLSSSTSTDVSAAAFEEEGNALMAACFALTFQSVRMDDGMAEFMTFCRGVVVVAVQMYYRRGSGSGGRFIFRNWVGADQQALLKPLIDAVPVPPRRWTDMAVAAIDGLEPLCTHPVEREYHRHLKEWAQTLYVDSFQAYQALSAHYGWWMQMPHAGFAHLVGGDPKKPPTTTTTTTTTSQTCVLLSTHWIALKKIMKTITDAEQLVSIRSRRGGESDTDTDTDTDTEHTGITRWLRYMNRQVDAEHRRYNRWPLWVQAQLDADLLFFGRHAAAAAASAADADDALQA